MALRTPRHRLECPNCGAPLRWKGEAPVVACRYCDTHVHTPSGTITEEPAEIRSEGGKGACAIFLLVLGINLLVGLIAFVSSLVTDGPGKMLGVPMDTLATLDLASSPRAAAEHLGLRCEDDADSLHVPLRGTDLEFASLHWEDADSQHVSSFGLHNLEGHPELAAVVAALEATLGRRLVRDDDGRHSWRWADASLNMAADGSHLGFHADPDDDPHWEYRTRLMWTVLIAASSGQQAQLEANTRKAWLAHGYDLSELAAMDLRYDVDGARSYVPAAFPGAHESVFSSLDFEIPLAHAWFGHAELSWPNEQGARIETTYLRPPPSHDGFPDQAGIKRCLDGALGPGERRSQDHLAGTWSADWDLPDGSWIHLSPNLLQLRRPRSDKLAPPLAWSEPLSALHDCEPG